MNGISMALVHDALALDDVDPDTTAWQDKALCAEVDGDLFFPDKGQNTTGTAKRVCMACEVRVECLEYALDRDERFGVWGGKSERQRRRILRDRERQRQGNEAA